MNKCSLSHSLPLIFCTLLIHFLQGRANNSPYCFLFFILYVEFVALAHKLQVILLFLLPFKNTFEKKLASPSLPSPLPPKKSIYVLNPKIYTAFHEYQPKQLKQGEWLLTPSCFYSCLNDIAVNSQPFFSWPEELILPNLITYFFIVYLNKRYY